MSLADFGPLIGDAANNFALITTQNSAIGSLYPDVVTREIHHDDLMITVQPREVGTPASDHAYKQPVTVEIFGGYSDSNAQTEGYVEFIYQQFLALQASKQPFTVTTRKRGYSNMLIRSFLTKTDETTWSTLEFVAFCQESIIVTTQTLNEGTTTQDPSDGNQALGDGLPAGVNNNLGGAQASSFPAVTNVTGTGVYPTWTNGVPDIGTVNLTPAPTGTPSSTAYSP